MKTKSGSIGNRLRRFEARRKARPTGPRPDPWERLSVAQLEYIVENGGQLPPDLDTTGLFDDADMKPWRALTPEQLQSVVDHKGALPLEIEHVIYGVNG
jgi:hypothetical protein